MLNNFDVSKMILPNGKSVKDNVKDEADRLKAILQVEIDRWYSSYSPVIYQPRSYLMRKSLYVDDACKITSDKLTISVCYSEDAFHKSLWSNDQVNVLYLMNYGYKVKSGWHKNIPYFGYRDPGGYLEEAVATFNKSSYLGLKATLIKPSSIYK